MSEIKATVDPEELKKLLDLKLLSLSSITKIDEEAAVAEGENYGSNMRRLKIVGTDTQGKTVGRNVVMKRDRKEYTGEGLTLSIFKCEIQMYTDVLPKLKKIMDEAGKTSDFDVLWPFCYGARNYDIILLEDLVEAGFTMKNRRIPLSSEYGIFCAGQLGKFHALTIAAVNRKIIDPKTIPKNIYTTSDPLLVKVFAGGLNSLALHIQSDPKWKSVAEKLRGIAKNCGPDLAQIAEETKDMLPVINHGDCWTNNMLFKCDANDQPQSLRFVDYQATHYGCFAWDLNQIMHSSMTADTRKSCYTDMIQSYRNSLVRTLNHLKEDVSKVPDLDSMKKMMDKVSLYGLYVYFAYFPLTVNTIEKSWEVDKVKSAESSGTHTQAMYDNPVFKDSFGTAIEQFKSQGLL